MVDYTNIPRDSRRVPLQTRVQFKFDRFTGFISEYSANISPGGMFLRTQTPQPPGTVLELEFRLGDGYELIKGRGEVIWVRTEDEGPSRPPGMGIRFLELSEGSKDLIYRIVDEHVLQGGTPFDVSQRPPDPIPAPAPAPDTVPPPFPELFSPPSAPPRREREPVPDAASPGKPGHDLPASPEPFPELLAQPVPKPPAAAAPPLFTTTFGSASVQQPRRRVLPWVLLAAGLVLAAAALLLGGRLREWTGLGAAEEAPAGRPAAGPAPGRASKQQGEAATTGARETPPAAAPSAGAPSASAPTPPAPAGPAPSPAPAAQGPALTRLDQVTAERTAGGTDILLWGNGAIPPETYQRARLEGNPPRELIRLFGVRGSSPQSRLVVGTPEVLQVRTGYHPEAGKGELYVVLDLAHPDVAITGIEQEPQRLRIHLRRR